MNEKGLYLHPKFDVYRSRVFTFRGISEVIYAQFRKTVEHLDLPINNVTWNVGKMINRVQPLIQSRFYDKTITEETTSIEVNFREDLYDWMAGRIIRLNKYLTFLVKPRDPTCDAPKFDGCSNSQYIIIIIDTTHNFTGEILEKPQQLIDALNKLKRLFMKTHQEDQWVHL